MKNILVIGADGKLGSGLMKQLKGRANGTTRRVNLQANEIYLDLVNPDSIESLKKNLNYDFAILVAAISEPDYCFLDQKISWVTNVESIVEILKILKEYRIKPVFISTEMVFDGNKGFYSESDKTDPILIYGKQKLEIEKIIRQNFSDFIIVRLSKIYSALNNDNSILNNFYSDIINSKVAYYAKDQYFSPTLQDDFELAVLGLIKKNLCGVFHVSSSHRISRWEFYQLFAEQIGNYGKVRPCMLKDIKFIEQRPSDLSLNGKKLSRAIGLTFTTPEAGIKKWIANNSIL